MHTEHSLDRMTSTSAKVIAAATQLFARRGMDGVNMRELTAVAGVNLAAVNYHFGTKDALWEAVWDSAATKVNGTRVAALHKVLEMAGAMGRPPALAAILESFIDPHLSQDASDEAAVLAQLVIKDRFSRTEMTHRAVRDYLEPLEKEYLKAFSLACPNIAPEDFSRRYLLMHGALAFVAKDLCSANYSGVSTNSTGAPDAHLWRTAVLDFLVHAIGAPSHSKRTT